MPIVTEALLNYRIPEVTQALKPKDVALYALSVGAGQDLMDETDLLLVDPHKGPLPLPSIVVVLCHPGFWLADPATGIDAVKVVHGEQGFRIHRTLPVEGTIISRSRVTGVVDKGPGKGALIYNEKELCNEAGEILATATSTTFARDDGGFGGPVSPVKPVHPIPEHAPDQTLDLVTRPEQALYYRLNGDMNPLHADPAVAARAGFDRPILHGLCTLGVVCRAVVRGLCGSDPARLRGVDLRFSSPVYPGETIRTEMWNGGSFRARVVERDVLVVNNGRAIIE